jgi:hypothetical protein
VPRGRREAIPALIRRGGYRTAVAAALLSAALATAGCGFGAGAGLGDVRLTVTRDYGARTLLATHDQVTESDTVMRVLDRNARISTRYGGGFIQSIDGLEGGEEGGRHYDWLFYVNGVASTVGAADYPLHGGDAVWWDYRDWSAAVDVPAVVGSWPQPFVDGYDGRRRPVSVDCLGLEAACRRVRTSLEREGVTVSDSSKGGSIRVLVGPWSSLRTDPSSAQIDEGPAVSGVFAEFRGQGHGFDLWGLNEAGAPVRRFGAGAGLVAATRRYEQPPIWLVTGATPRGVEAAAGILDARDLGDRYAVAVEGGDKAPLPVPTGQ